MDRSIIDNFSELRKRVDWFMSTSSHGRNEVTEFIRKIDSLGQIAIFGGMLRDMSINNASDFNSDIDLVIDTDNEEMLERLLLGCNVSTNKFGGKRIKLDSWDIDLWTLESTWAIREKKIEANGLKDLCATTFFDWDAIVYDLSSSSIYSIDRYIERIRNKILSINLEDNPNPCRNIFKSFLYCERYGAKLSPKLAHYIFNKLKQAVVTVPEFDSDSQSRKDYSENSSLYETWEEFECHMRQYPSQPFEKKIVNATNQKRPNYA